MYRTLHPSTAALAGREYAGFPIEHFRRYLRTAAIAAATAFAAGAALAEEPKAPDDELAEVTVFGRGETRQVAEIGAADIQQAVPGTSAIKVVAKLPGVSFQSADAYGSYEYSTKISVRGFNQNHLGFTLDGVPLGDMSYGNHNGLHISRAISSENIGKVVLSQGAGALDTASSSNLGGTLQFFSADPAHEMGVKASVTGGSVDTKHAFARFETGELGAYGTRGYVSYTYQNANKWKGEGAQKQQQVNTKIVQPIGSATLTAFFNWSDRRENDYQDMSLAMINRLGYRWDNISNNWPLMVRIANIVQGNAPGPFPAPIQSPDDAYANGSGLRQDKLAGATINVPFNESLVWDSTVYLHHNRGEGQWYTPYMSTASSFDINGTGAPDGSGGTISLADSAPISVRATDYHMNRWGLRSSLGWTLGQHTVSGGLWYENNDFDQPRNFYGLELASPQRDSLEFQNDPYFTQLHYAFITKTKMFYLQDTWRLGEALKLDLGFKSLDVHNSAKALIDTRFTSNLAGDIDAKKNFLPQVGFNYTLTKQSELFGDVNRNMRAFIASVGGLGENSPFATSPANFALLKAQGGLRPETSTTYEVGWRYNTAPLQAVATLYLVDFKDRLLGNSIGSGIVGNPIVLQNVGGVRTKGAEVGLRWQFLQSWAWSNSLSFNDSRYQGDVVTNLVDSNGQPVQTITRTGGKHVVDAPRELFSSELQFTSNGFFGNLELNYVGRRYFTYTNSLSQDPTVQDGLGYVNGFALLNLGAGYEFPKLRFADNLTIQLNVTNLADKRYIATIGSQGFTNFGDSQSFLLGAPREWFLSLSTRF